MANKLVNVAKGKKVQTTLDFCKVFSNLDIYKKVGVVKNLQKSLDTGTTLSGKPLKEQEKPAVKQLLAWCNLNLMVGNELAPPETYINH